MITLYGIPNCDTVKKARRWLEQQGIDYQFANVREKPLTKTRVKGWIATLGIDKVVNKRSSTWKQLSQAERDGLTTASAVELICANPTLFKRPVLESGKPLHAGFSEKDYKVLLL